MNDKWNISEFLEKIHDCSRENSIAVLLRHSIREEIKDARLAYRALLTDEGKKLAFDFGKNLPNDRHIRLFHSPIRRCKETAESIYQGIQSNNGSGSIMGEKDFLLSP